MADIPTSDALANGFKKAVDAFLENHPTSPGFTALLEQMAASLLAVGESIRFDVALRVLQSEHYQHQLYMGEVLQKTNTPLPMPAEDFISQLAPTINASANTVVQYLRNQVGQRAALEASHRLLERTTDARTRSGIECFQYWLGYYPDSRKQQQSPWYAVRDGRLLESELRRELSPEHILHGKAVRAVAQRFDCDDVVFAIEFNRSYALVRLTWSGRSETEPFPWTRLFESFDDAILQDQTSEGVFKLRDSIKNATPPLLGVSSRLVRKVNLKTPSQTDAPPE